MGVAAGDYVSCALSEAGACSALFNIPRGGRRAEPAQRMKAAARESHDVRSFHPGQVYAGQELCVVEAMKMQNVLTAPRDGVVKELLATAGSTLSADQAILSFEEATKAARA